MKKYHDEEWGRPVHDDIKLFEMLILEGKSCGLSWELILKKRKHMMAVFDNFNPEILANYNAAKLDELMQDPGVIRHRLKLIAVVENAKVYFKINDLHGSLDKFLWRYVNFQPIIRFSPEVITRSDISDKLSKDLKKLGFKFCGSTIIYSFMQAVGMINAHELDCFAR
ncbi:DNA-3-methyladenine glycosylase I [Alphaproteobacteria bacterium]|nr:DNA-3-methyladenine glycosylase I [Alphaproteobacteria bacterium]